MKNQKSIKYKSKIKEIDNELNKVKLLIKNTSELLNLKNYENENYINGSEHNLYLINKDKDIFPLNFDKNNNLALNSKSNRVIENEYEVEKQKEHINLMEKNKYEKNMSNNNYNYELKKSLSENSSEQFDSFNIEKKNNRKEDQEKEKEKAKEKENNSLLYNKHISINNGSNFWVVKNNIHEKKEDSILSSLSSFEKDINFIDSSNYLQNPEFHQVL